MNEESWSISALAENEKRTKRKMREISNINVPDMDMYLNRCAQCHYENELSQYLHLIVSETLMSQKSLCAPLVTYCNYIKIES